MRQSELERAGLSELVPTGRFVAIHHHPCFYDECELGASLLLSRVAVAQSRLREPGLRSL